MKLLIHDLNGEEWKKRAKEYEGWTILSDDGGILPCTGCFGCWNRTPGSCVMKDGYGDMGYLIHHAEEVHVISRYTYGGFSGFVKNVFDRSLGYVLPHFEIVDGESHHKKRYDEEKPYTFIFYGPRLSEEEKKSARRYVKAVTVNMRTLVKDVIFEESEETSLKEKKKPQESGGIVLLNCSMRQRNSLALAKELAKRIKEETLLVNLSEYLKNHDGLLEFLKDARTLVLCTPLYVDGLPSQLIRLLEHMEQHEWKSAKKIYVLANMGLYESGQLVSLFEAVKQWCKKTGFDYCGGLGVAAGELVSGLMEAMPFEKGFTSKIAKDEDLLAKAIQEGKAVEDIYSSPVHFPRWLYIAIANGGWARMARTNGITKEDLYRRV